MGFAENGLVAYKDGAKVAEKSLADELGDDKIQKLVNWVLRYLSDLTIPVKRGTFIEYRTGMMNISPIGRNCSREERNAFEVYDNEHKVRTTMVEAMKKEFEEYDLTYSIGGQISFDLFPRGWDKTAPGGNDHEIFEHPRTKGHTVTGPDHTRKL